MWFSMQLTIILINHLFCGLNVSKSMKDIVHMNHKGATLAFMDFMEYDVKQRGMQPLLLPSTTQWLRCNEYGTNTWELSENPFSQQGLRVFSFFIKKMLFILHAKTSFPYLPFSHSLSLFPIPYIHPRGGKDFLVKSTRSCIATWGRTKPLSLIWRLN